MSDQLAEDVRAVRDYIDEHGWVQGDFISVGGAGCLLGAGYSAMLHKHGNISSCSSYREHLIDVIATRGDVEVAEFAADGHYPRPRRWAIEPDTHHIRAVVPYFNDEVLKTKAEVLEFLDKAAIAAEEKA